MKTIEFSDNDGTKIVVQHSSLATEEAYRIYTQEKEIPERETKVVGSEFPALHLTRLQAEILIKGLQDLFNDNDNLYE